MGGKSSPGKVHQARLLGFVTLSPSEAVGGKSHDKSVSVLLRQPGVTAGLRGPPATSSPSRRQDSARRVDRDCGRAALRQDFAVALPGRAGNASRFYGDASGRLFFTYLDTQVLGGGFTQAEFWAEALAPVQGQLVDPDPEGSLAKQYRVCQDNGFGSFTLEVLFRRLGEQGRQLALLLDEFDLLLHHPILNCGEFFGSLRNLASTSKGSLALVIASRLPLAQLNTETQAFNPTGSPYFNIFSEIVLGNLPDHDIDTLLGRAGDRFTPLDRFNIRQLAGGHAFATSCG